MSEDGPAGDDDDDGDGERSDARRDERADERRTARAGLAVLAVALVARLAVVAWAAGSIPPTADGGYYHVVAQRIARGEGYTWLWPDGAVTYAAHYPVGYPGMIGIAYALFGSKPVVAMMVNAAIGAAGAWAAFDLLARAGATSRRLAVAGGLAVGLHPALVPYTAAMMTEGVTAGVLVIAAAMAGRAGAGARARAGAGAWAGAGDQGTGDREQGTGNGGGAWGWGVAAGVAMGVAVLVRPQVIVLAPVLGWVAGKGGAIERGKRAAVVLMTALAVVAPWTARNCVRMEKCALVSVNGGWNFAIGTQTTDGGWHELAVPDECRDVFDEAKKDECFGRAAMGLARAHPGAWLARAPAKLRQTFDYFGAAPWYLHAANPERFPYRAKLALGALETLASRLLLAAALVAVAKLPGPRRRARWIVAGVGLVACVLVPGALGYVACAVAALLLGRRALEAAPIVVPATAAVILATAATHAVFFGAGRYGLVVVPFVTALAFVRKS